MAWTLNLDRGELYIEVLVFGTPGLSGAYEVSVIGKNHGSTPSLFCGNNLSLSDDKFSVGNGNDIGAVQVKIRNYSNGECKYVISFYQNEKRISLSDGSSSVLALTGGGSDAVWYEYVFVGG